MPPLALRREGDVVDAGAGPCVCVPAAGVRGSDHRAGKSAARAAILARSVSLRAQAAVARRSYSSRWRRRAGAARRSSRLRGWRRPAGCRGRRPGSGGGRARRRGGPARRRRGAAGRLRRRGFEFGLDGEGDLEGERGDGVEQQAADRAGRWPAPGIEAQARGCRCRLRCAGRRTRGRSPRRGGGSGRSSGLPQRPQMTRPCSRAGPSRGGLARRSSPRAWADSARRARLSSYRPR